VHCPIQNLLNAVLSILFCLIVAITVRSAKHEKILREEWAEAEKVGVDFSIVHFDKI